MEEERGLLSKLASKDAVLDALLPAQDAVYVKDRAGCYLMVNSTGASNLGYDPESLVGQTDREVFPGELGERLWRSDQAIMVSGEPRTVEEPVIVGGRLRTYLTTKAPLRDASGHVMGLVGVSSDVTSLTEANEEVRRREAQLSEAQALTQVGSWEWEMSTGDLTWSSETYRILGRDPGELAPTFQTFVDYVHPDDRQRFAEAIAGAVERGSVGSLEIEHRIIRPDGEERFCRCRGRRFDDLDGTPLRMLGAVQDVTDRKRDQLDLERRALRDSLTGLANRTVLFEGLSHALALARRREWELAVLFIDLDGFKLVNYELGHQAGDEVLRTASKRLRAAVRASDTLARLGGDEFVVVCDDMPSATTALDTAERVRTALRTPVEIQEKQFQLSASVGITFAGGRHETPEDILHDADRAMYLAKQRGGDCAVVSARDD